MKDALNKLFDYRDGKLYWRVSLHPRIKIGDVAGHRRKDGYVQIKIDKVLQQAHRLIYIMHHGDIPKNLEIDHINNIKYDNRIENLRAVTSAENAMNKSSTKSASCKLKGVRFHKQHKRFYSVIIKDGIKYHLGYFSTEALAYAAYCEKAKELHGIFANFG